MRKLFWIIPIILLVSWSAPAKTVDRILAQVNDDIITLSDMNRAMAMVRQDLATRYSGEQLEQEVKKAEKAVLDDLIEQRLLLQKASEIGFGKDADVQAASYIEKLRKDNGIKDMQEFERALGQQGDTLAGFRERIKKQYITQGMISEFVASRITLLTQEVEKYYKDHAAEFTTQEEVTLSEIYIPSEGNALEAEARANDIYKRLGQGESFATLVSQYSKGLTAAKGGSIGTYLTAKLNPDTVAAIAKVKEGDFSALVKGKDGFSIYRVDSRKVAALRPLDEVKDEIKNRIWQQKFEPERKRYIAQLKEDAYIQIYSAATK
jgi:peptidyl-prolyl cis-trans isomerase SurA